VKIHRLEHVMADKELTADEKRKLDRLLEITGMLEALEPTMPIGVYRALLNVCRHQGEGIRELAHRTGRDTSVATMELNEWGTGGERYGRRKQELIEWGSEPGPQRKPHLTPKGVALRKRLLALL
jgi:hypothetical protein